MQSFTENKQRIRHVMASISKILIPSAVDITAQFEDTEDDVVSHVVIDALRIAKIIVTNNIVSGQTDKVAFDNGCSAVVFCINKV